MNSGTQALIETLKTIDACPDISPATFLTDGEQDALHPLIQEAIYAASGELITSKGRPNFTEHKALEAAGFPVSKGESDSFGWLTGVIRTSKGQLVFG